MKCISVNDISIWHINEKKFVCAETKEDKDIQC